MALTRYTATETIERIIKLWKKSDSNDGLKIWCTYKQKWPGNKRKTYGKSSGSESLFSA